MHTGKRRTLATVLLVIGILLGLTACGILGWYWYDTHVDRSGWELEDGSYYYRDFHNHRVSGWKELDGNRYYFGTGDIMLTGWQEIDGRTHYFDTDGTLFRGWLQLNGQKYYLDPEGVRTTGWLDLDDGRYYLDESGVMVTDWMALDGEIYYFTEEGHPVTRHMMLDGEKYFFRDDGAMFTGWMDQGESRCYYLPDGPMATGWQEIDEKLYFFSEEGLLQYGWLTQGEYLYYLQEDGSAATGPVTIDGEEHFFTPKGIHVVLVNYDHPIPDYWNPTLVTLFGWNRIAEEALEPMRRMLADCVAAGYEYNFNSSYRSHENQVAIVEQRTEEYMDQGLDYRTAYAKTLETAAVPGTSEHEMGVAADILGDAIPWLQEHCWEYGFILRYPPEKGPITGVINEPWHYRYVGIEVSMDMKDTGLCLEEYLGAGAVSKPVTDPPAEN